MSVRQRVLRELFRKEEASCDVQVFFISVARELDHLAAIEEWWSDRVERIGRTCKRSIGTPM